MKVLIKMEWGEERSLLTLNWPSATRVTQNFLEQVHLDTCRWICGKILEKQVCLMSQS